MGTSAVAVRESTLLPFERWMCSGFGRGRLPFSLSLPLFLCLARGVGWRCGEWIEGMALVLETVGLEVDEEELCMWLWGWGWVRPTVAADQEVVVGLVFV